MTRHYMTPLLAPASVALVGASEREGSLGRIVWQNLAAGGLGGPLHPVNPKHRQVFGERAFARLRDLAEPPDLAVIVTPARTVPEILADAGKAGVRAAAVLTSGFGETGDAGRALQDEALAAARAQGVRMLGPNCLGLMRTDAGLNATFSPVPARPGKLALVSQSGAICTAILDWAFHAEVGFSSVVSLGAAADVDFGEVLDFLVADPATDAIPMYAEGIRDARRFLSALRDGAMVRVRPIRPEDAALEQRFFEALSERSRYQRFMHELRHLPPPMLARFTQLDYDRELALVALAPGGAEFIGVGRYAPNPDGESAEFALTVADAWQGRGLGRALLERLCRCARAAGYRSLEGHVLNANRDMLDLALRLGFAEAGRDGEVVKVVRDL
jgi:GNAT superfamily N-acetyltransferase/predicted CoA-binding protein